MEYLISKTTKKQREKYVKEAFAVSTSDALPPSEEATKLIKEYIDGKKELQDVQKEIITMYKKS